MKKELLFIVLTMMFLCCCDKDEKKCETINISDSSKKSLNEMFNSITLIPLETSDESLIGIDLRKLEVYNHRLYLLNSSHSSNNVLCFADDGKFLFKIDRIGDGPEEYAGLYDFFINKTTQQLLLLNENNIISYNDLDGNFLCSKKKPEDTYTRQLIYVNDSTYFGYNDAECSPNESNLIDFDAKTFGIRTESNILKEPLGNFGFRTLAVYEGGIFFYNTTNNIIYDITDLNFPQEVYFLNLGKDVTNMKKNIGKQNISDDEKAALILQEFYRNEKIKIENSFFINKKWIAFTLINSKLNNDFTKSILFYNKEDRETTYSPDIDFFNVFNMSDCEVLGSDEDDYLYVLWKGYLDVEVMKKIQESNFPEKHILLNMKAEDNPILLKVK